MIVDDFLKMVETNSSVFIDDEIGLFKDSIHCFNAGIYRPAYIMAYQGVMIYFRRILQNADMPTGFNTSKWQMMQANLRRDQDWEEEVNNAIRRQPNPKATPPVIAILSIPDSIRKDFDYWRNRRNDSAHYKKYNINDSHVLAFYSFLTQYLLTISVEGGLMSLLHEIRDHFDPAKTSPNEPIQPLIDKILVMVTPDEMDTFFRELEGAMGHRFDGRYEQTIKEIIKGDNKTLREYVIKFVRQEKYLKENLINRFPELVGHLVDKTEAREFWMKSLKGCRNRMAIVSCMIFVGIVKNSEKEEAINKMIDYAFENNEGMGEISDEKLDLLKSEGLLKFLKEKYFNSSFTSKNAMVCGKQKYEFFSGFMYHIPINKEWVEVIVDIFSQPSYPLVWQDIYIKQFLLKADYKAKFDKIVSDNGILVPQNLLSYPSYMLSYGVK